MSLSYRNLYIERKRWWCFFFCLVTFMYMLTHFLFAPDVFNQSPFETQLLGSKSYYLMLNSIWPLVMVFHNSVDPLPTNLSIITVSVPGLLLVTSPSVPILNTFWFISIWTGVPLSSHFTKWHYISGPAHDSDVWDFLSAAVCLYLDSICSEENHRLCHRKLNVWWDQYLFMEYSYKIVLCFQNITFCSLRLDCKV